MGTQGYTSHKTYIHCAQNDNLFKDPLALYHTRNNCIAKTNDQSFVTIMSALIRGDYRGEANYHMRRVMGCSASYFNQSFELANVGRPDDSRWCF